MQSTVPLRVSARARERESGGGGGRGGRRGDGGRVQSTGLLSRQKRETMLTRKQHLNIMNEPRCLIHDGVTHACLKVYISTRSVSKCAYPLLRLLDAPLCECDANLHVFLLIRNILILPRLCLAEISPTFISLSPS